MKNIDIGFLGSGFMAHTHAQALAHIDGTTITCVCDTIKESAEKFVTDCAPGAAVYTDFDAMLNEQELEALYVCIPPFAHNGQVEKAAEKGIHLFMEKPIAMTIERAESMTAAIKKAGVISQVGYHFRFRKAIRRMRELIDTGQAGRPTLFQGRYWTNMDGKPWWRLKDKSGGQIVEQVTHIYDMALYLLGNPAQAAGYIANLCHAEREDYTIEDTTAGLVQCENGALASVVSSNCAVPERFTGDFRAVFEHITLDYRTTGDWRDKDEATIYINGEQETIVEDGDAMLDENRDFIEAIRTGRPAHTPVEDGLRAVKTIDAILRSAEQNGMPMTISG